LDALEARAVPYSPEEMALFKTPDAISANTDSKDDKKSSGKSADDARLLVSEGERAFAARHYDEPQLATLVLTIALTNFWNRVNITTRQVAGEWTKSAEGKAWLKEQEHAVAQ